MTKIPRTPGLGGAQFRRISSGHYARIQGDNIIVQKRPKQPRKKDANAQYNRDLMRYIARLNLYTTPDELEWALTWAQGSNDTYKDVLTRAAFGTLYAVELPDGTLMHPADHSYQPAAPPEPESMAWEVKAEWSFAVHGATNAINYVLDTGITELFIIRDNVGTSSLGRAILAVSTDGGATYDKISGHYAIAASNGVPAAGDGFSMPSTATTIPLSWGLWVLGLNLGNRRVIARMNDSGNGVGIYTFSTSPVNAVQIFCVGGGNFNSGAFTILGR